MSASFVFYDAYITQTASCS
ncbi:hypothetical protein JHU04_002448 [Brenneria sp. 4F2]|nr:hypothetical protein [Brenneria bubanii]